MVTGAAVGRKALAVGADTQAQAVAGGRGRRASLVHVPNHAHHTRQDEGGHDDAEEQAAGTRRLAVWTRGLFFAHRFRPRQR
jgi:hypothetical protein